MFLTYGLLEDLGHRDAGHGSLMSDGLYQSPAAVDETQPRFVAQVQHLSSRRGLGVINGVANWHKALEEQVSTWFNNTGISGVGFEMGPRIVWG